jgi:hypothetical protein
LNFFLIINRYSGSSKLPRELLHEVIDKWEASLNDKLFASQTDKPNLADIVSTVLYNLIKNDK